MSGSVHPRGIVSINPTTGEILKAFEAHTPQEVERRLALAESSFREFRRMSFPDRARLLNKSADLLDREKPTLARTMTLEMGKPLRAAHQEVEKCANACRFYAENGAAFLADEPASVKSKLSYVCYQPLGPVLLGHALDFRASECSSSPQPNGGQRGFAKARLQCPAMRVGDRSYFPTGRLSCGSLSGLAGRLGRGPGQH